MHFAGFSDRNWSNDSTIAGESSPSSKSGESKHHSALSSLLSRLFDEKIPLKKKVRMIAYSILCFSSLYLLGLFFSLSLIYVTYGIFGNPKITFFPLVFSIFVAVI